MNSAKRLGLDDWTWGMLRFMEVLDEWGNMRETVYMKMYRRFGFVHFDPKSDSMNSQCSKIAPFKNTVHQMVNQAPNHRWYILKACCPFGLASRWWSPSDVCCLKKTYWLVVWNMACKFSPIVGMMIQSDFHIFKGGRYTTNEVSSSIYLP